MKKFIATFLLTLALVMTAHAIITQVYKRFTYQTTTGYTAAWQFSSGQTSTPGDDYAVTNGFLPSNWTITLTTSGTPATCTYEVFGSQRLGGDSPTTADFAGGSMAGVIDCTQPKTTVHVTGKPWNTGIGRLETISGGSSPGVQLEILAR